MLSALYSYSDHGNPELQELTNKILKKSIAPLLNFINQWVYSGTLVDPNEEFFIMENSGIVDGEKYWQRKYEIRAEMIPSFLKRDLARIILVAGKTKTYLRKFCGRED